MSGFGSVKFGGYRIEYNMFLLNLANLNFLCKYEYILRIFNVKSDLHIARYQCIIHIILSGIKAISQFSAIFERVGTMLKVRWYYVINKLEAFGSVLVKYKGEIPVKSF